MAGEVDDDQTVGERTHDLAAADLVDGVAAHRLTGAQRSRRGAVRLLIGRRPAPVQVTRERTGLCVARRQRRVLCKAVRDRQLQLEILALVALAAVAPVLVATCGLEPVLAR